MTFTTTEILKDIQEKTLGIPAGNGGIVTQDMCKRDTERPARFMQKRIERVIEDSPTEGLTVVHTREIEKVLRG